MQELSPTLLQEITNRLVNELRPEEIVLFGSHAWGEPNENSDLDLLVIVSESNLSAAQRAMRAHRCLSGLNVPKDILVRTRAEVERFRHIRASLEYQIFDKGTVLYERQTGARSKLAYQSPA